MLEAFSREEADRLLLLGDILYHGPRNDLPEGYAPKEVIAMLNPMKKKLLSLLAALALCAGLAAPAAAAGTTFSDVPAAHWAHDAVDYVTDLGLFSGTVGELTIAQGLIVLAACIPMALGGLLSGIAQGRVAAASINIVAKNPNDWSKGMVLCIIVEFYAILSLLISFLMIMFGF